MNTTNKISLHRAMAEIKSLTYQIQNFNQSIVSTATKNNNMVGHLSADAYKIQSQSNIDNYKSMVERLFKLRVARNLANSTTIVNVRGEQMTIDAALTKKSSVYYMQQLLNQIKAQMNTAQMQVAQANTEIDRKVDNQVTAIAGSNKTVKQEELNAIREMMERTTGREIVMGRNVMQFIEETERESVLFMTEIDFALSEINATTFVDV